MTSQLTMRIAPLLVLVATLALAAPASAHAARLQPVLSKPSAMNVTAAQAWDIGWQLVARGGGQHVDAIYTCARGSWLMFNCRIDTRESVTGKSCTRMLHVRLGASGRVSWRWAPPMVCAD
jgi:hypothetical protein